MAFFQSLWITALLTVTSINGARYGIMASPPSFRISHEMPSGPTGLFLSVSGNLFLIIFVLTTKGSPYLGDTTLTAEYRRITYIEGVSFFYRANNESSANIFDCRNISPICFVSFYIFIENIPAVIFISKYSP
jgi:hypothetical protein